MGPYRPIIFIIGVVRRGAATSLRKQPSLVPEFAGTHYGRVGGWVVGRGVTYGDRKYDIAPSTVIWSGNSQVVFSPSKIRIYTRGETPMQKLDPR